MIDVRNPRPGKIDYAFAPVDNPQLARAVAAARDGIAHWCEAARWMLVRGGAPSTRAPV